MLAKGKQAELDDSGRYRVPVRVPLALDIDFMARALAIEFGSPPQRQGKQGWSGRVGIRNAHSACVALVQRRIDGAPEVVDESHLAGWRTYVVEHFGLFPREALPGGSH